MAVPYKISSLKTVFYTYGKKMGTAKQAKCGKIFPVLALKVPSLQLKVETKTRDEITVRPALTLTFHRQSRLE